MPQASSIARQALIWYATGQMPQMRAVMSGGSTCRLPTYHRGCYGCFGPMASPNVESLTNALSLLGMAESDITRIFRTFNAGAPDFRAASESVVEFTGRKRR